MKKVTVLVILLLSSLNVYSGAKEYTYIKKELGQTTEFRTGAVGAVSIPTDMLKGARLSSFDGLVFLFKDKSNFSMEVMTDKTVGYVGVDMRSWPEYLFELGANTGESEGVIKEAINSKIHIVDKQIAPYEIRKFSTKEGLGYWAIGKEKSLIIFTSREVSNQIVTIYTKDMKERDILKIIINGVVE